VIHSATVALPPAEVLARAKAFFSERVPQAAAFPEREGPGFVVLRGQGGEEVVVSAAVDGGGHIQVNAKRELSAAIDGGGSIVYDGDPRVSSAIDGGGSVSKASR